MIGEVIGGLGSALGGIGGFLAGQGHDEEAARRYAEAKRLYETMQLPNFDMRSLSPQELSIVAEYMPELYQFVPPGEAPVTAQAGPEGREAQLSALDYFNQVQQEGLPTLDRLNAIQAQQAMGQQAQRDRDAVLRDAQLRGSGGSGTAIQAQLAGGQQSANLARGFGDDLARQAILNRLNAASQGAQLGGQLRSQDLDQSALNANIWNRFNEFVSQGLTEANRYAAGARQAASDQNVGNQQRVADTNTQLQNQFALRNQDYLNQMRQQQYGNEFDRRKAITGALGDQAKMDLAQGSAENSMLQSLGGGLGTAVGGYMDAQTQRKQYEELRNLLQGLQTGR